MIEKGRSTLESDDQGRILDRLAALEQVISPDLIREVLAATQRVNGRACILTHEVMLWVVLAMGLLTHLPIRQVFRHARRLREDESTPGRSSLCEGRRRLGVEPLRELHARVVRPLATPETPGAFYRQWRLVGIDGTVLDVPDSLPNAVFGRSLGGRGEGAFPQVRKASLVELGTHVELAFEVGGYRDGETTLARRLWDRLPPDALLLEDRGFICYDDWKALNSRVKLLVRVKSSLVLKRLTTLSDGSYLAKIYPSPQDRRRDRDGIARGSWSA